MSKEEILDYFKDINHAYNDCTKYDTLKSMLDELQEPCSDAISRQAAIDAAIEAVDDWDGGCNLSREEYIRKALETLSPVTPAEKVGQWLCSDDMFEWGVCSLCRENSYEPFVYAEKRFKYCPSCGAKMQEVGE